MKLQALLIALALTAGGSAFAASDAAPVDGTPAPGKQTMTTPHKAKAKTHKAMHKTAHHTRASTRHMGASATMPTVDLGAHDRQSRIDEAYAKWLSSHK